MEEKIIGIDLGTSNSAAAVMVGGKPTIVPAAEGVSIGGKAVPSYVAFTKDGQVLVGEPARRQAALNPETTIQAIKRKMGTDYTVSIFGKTYTPQQISGFILRKIKNDAEAFLGQKVSKAVITVPAYFNDAQRQATKDAGEIAGLEVVRLINEPTAAAFAFGLDKTEGEHKILVFDFGGGTLDVTIMEFGGNVFTVKSTSGDTQLGGTDMDNALLNYVADDFHSQNGIDLRVDKMAMQRLREGVEKAKVELSTTFETTINLPFITADASGPKHLVMPITRAKLESLVQPIIDRCREPVNRAVADAGLTPQQIDNIILVGGPTRMPIVQKFVESYFGKTPERGVDPMECVAMGAAIQGGIMGGEVKSGMVLVDVTPLTLGIETLGGVVTEMIKRNTAVPISKTQIFTTASDSQTQVEIHVLQGERPMAKDNMSLGRFILDGIAPARRGEPQIEVSYDIDANGIVHVTAKDKATGKEQHITIENATKLKDDEIERMKREAEQFADQDKRVKEEVELKNRADQVVFSGRKTLTENAARISPDVKAEAEKKLTELEDLVRDNKTSDIEAKIDEVNTAFSKVTEDLQHQAGQQGPAAAQENQSEAQQPPQDGQTVEGQGTPKQ
ncbi:molecular chaperone DnaK [Candidatus Cryosericum septentrionale]|jgi:molecular chaperone DnaK|uniref:Chaperone protein DnaK n=1 Tax=Candidatus Cryosericum septentrionale TaxID=2290913 RepID=A0A398E1T1_9BACT|nr:molecular chaperone DnaK [Candidatus Cryosericum septentrionale]RIE16591.1 molecular chaperone DnaK [Candidatus Cryosericum septentrionale]